MSIDETRHAMNSKNDLFLGFSYLSLCHHLLPAETAVAVKGTSSTIQYSAHLLRSPVDHSPDLFVRQPRLCAWGVVAAGRWSIFMKM
jgi:hypothetical protein